MNEKKKHFTKIPTESSFWPWCVFTEQSAALNARVALYLLKVVLWNGWNAYFDFPEAFSFFSFFALWAEWKYPAPSSLAELKKRHKQTLSTNTTSNNKTTHTHWGADFIVLHPIKWVQSTNLAVVKKIPRGRWMTMPGRVANIAQGSL